MNSREYEDNLLHCVLHSGKHSLLRPVLIYVIKIVSKTSDLIFGVLRGHREHFSVGVVSPTTPPHIMQYRANLGPF